MQQLDIEQMMFILDQMKTLQAQHEKACVVYDLERKQILITYPLPPDFYNLKNIDLKDGSDL